MTAVRHPTTSKLEGRVLAQPIKIIAVLMTATDRKHPRTDDAVLWMRHPFLIPLVRKQLGKASDDPDTFLRQSQ